MPTWRYDLAHAGQNTNETALIPTNINGTSFGKLFSVPVDSTVYAQPLYMPGLKMSDGLVHNVLFVATENDSVYAFDADSNLGANNKPIWQISLLTPAHGASSGATAVPYADTGSADVAPTVGVTGTPAINSATNTMYLVAATKENGTYFSRLHAINIITGAEQSGSPVNITATVSGTGAGSSGGKVTFSPLWQNQRPAVDYYNGYVYFGYASHGDKNNWHGWLFAYDATTLKQTAVLCVTPNDIGGGVWGSGSAFPIDTSVSGGRMFVVTGNGGWSSPPFTPGTDFGESVIAFNIANGNLTPTDEFTAFNYASLNTRDWDQGSGGLLMLPDQQGANPHLLITVGKEGRITLLNRDHLGGYASGASSNTNAVQDISSVVASGQGFWMTPAYWNGNVYVWSGGSDSSGTPNKGMLFKINSGVMDTSPDSQTTFTSAYPGAFFSISSNGAQNGIAWALKTDQFNTNGPAVLYAFDATDLSKTLYESDSNATRDSAGPANKFSVPVVTNGKVYVATRREVDVYGLLNGATMAAAPVITPKGGTFSATQLVTMSTATSSASIYYALNGSTPTAASTLYTGPITIGSNTTVKAIAVAPGYLQSSVSSAMFTFTSQCPSPSANGINVCSPIQGASGLSPVSISAGATVAGGVYRFELWSGGTKLASVSNSGVMSQALSLAPGSYQLTFTAYNAAGTHVYATRNITVASSGSASFSLSGGPFVIGWRGGAIHVPIKVTPSGGFTGTVALACSVSPPSGGVSIPACTISAQPPVITGSSGVTGYAYVTTKTTTTLGNYTLNLKGTSGSLAKSISIPFTVN
ncbi:chitobiase/beta-hexosaminidase C-terminal domain-containing protein [Occallatibacter savannae]|uniref:chitobiase/beta-hexosaminidase C-terminal domain-containing protein n=1 Tax=Occallatibacter savannae TaxID=1002691 RepID=UPI0013A557DD|nr:chitobiase/beta-hexosaminidase C-terminal domain-containing protein [Occallatibacter savannae]